MSSLSTKAGTNNPRNFHRAPVETGKVLSQNFINGTLVSSSASLILHRDASTEIFSGKVLKDFHKRKNSGELLPYTSYTKLTREVSTRGPSVAEFGFTNPNTGWVYLYRRSWADGSHKPYIFNAELGTDKCSITLADRVISDLGINTHVFVQQAAARLYGRGWDGLTFAAELHKLVRMFRQVVPQAYKLLKEAFTLYKSGALRRLGYASIDAWLATRYGWRILLYDIEDINNLMKEIDEEQRLRSKERAGDLFSTTLSDDIVGSGGHAISRSDSSNFTIKVRGSIIADFMPSKITLNPVLTAWELVPYSFVIDWFFNVGRALEAMTFLTLNNRYTAAIGLDVLCERTVRYDVSFSGNWTNAGHSTIPDIEVDDTWRLLRRKPVTVPMKPLLNINLDAFKVMDLVALIVKLFK